MRRGMQKKKGMENGQPVSHKGKGDTSRSKEKEYFNSSVSKASAITTHTYQKQSKDTT